MSSIEQLQVQVASLQSEVSGLETEAAGLEAQNIIYRQKVTELRQEVEDIKFDLSIVKGVLTDSLKTIRTLMFEPSYQELCNALQFLNAAFNNCKDVYERAFGPTKKVKLFSNVD